MTIVEVRRRDIPNHPGHKVGDNGSVWRGRKLLNQITSKKGYKYVHLRKRYFKVHRLVLLSFRGRPPKGMMSCHWDGDKGNNDLNNLRWGTSKENAEDKKRHGRVARGERNGFSRLSEDDVLFIKRELAKGWNWGLQLKLANQFGVDKSAISKIARGISWNWLVAKGGGK